MVVRPETFLGSNELSETENEEPTSVQYEDQADRETAMTSNTDGHPTRNDNLNCSVEGKGLFFNYFSHMLLVSVISNLMYFLT